MQNAHRNELILTVYDHKAFLQSMWKNRIVQVFTRLFFW